jgi:hypothetical protein
MAMLMLASWSGLVQTASQSGGTEAPLQQGRPWNRSQNWGGALSNFKLSSTPLSRLNVCFQLPL